MAIKTKDFNEILVRRPFFKLLPTESAHSEVYSDRDVSEPDDLMRQEIYTQSQMLREYYPTAHRIMNPEVYPDVWKYDKQKKKYFKQPITRTAFAFQRVLKVKQVAHLCGNDIQFELSEKSDNTKEELENTNSLLDLREGWLEMGMEERFYESVDAYKTVGDTAVLAYFEDNGKPATKTFSFVTGDKLYPHYDSITGEMLLFARKYRDLDEDGKTVTEWVEIWDDKYMYRAKRGISSSDFFQKVKETFGLAGFTIVEQKEHGFNFVPVAYYRNDEGPCWAFSQQTIEHYEEAVSYFFENNKAYAFPIFYVKGKGVKLTGDMKGSVKAVAIPSEKGEAGFLNQQDVSTSYNTLLNTLYEKIFEQSFGVKPPELKSGDLPGVAVKLLYSPAIELAINEAPKLQPFLDQLVKLVRFAWGQYIKKQATLMTLKVNAWVKPYIHMNWTETITNLATAVQNGFVSKQTASERATEYAKNDEIDRYWREDLKKRRRDLEFEIREEQARVREEVKKTEEVAKINRQFNGEGQDINTGFGEDAGRPNRSGREWDENGNYEGRSGWEKFDGNL